jgi:hypothetical protein
MHCDLHPEMHFDQKAEEGTLIGVASEWHQIQMESVQVLAGGGLSG